MFQWEFGVEIGIINLYVVCWCRDIVNPDLCNSKAGLGGCMGYCCLHN